MERQAAEIVDPREDRTSAVRSRLNDILFNSVQGLAAGTSPKTNASSSQPLPSTNEPPQGAPTNGFSPLPQLPPLGFDSSDTEAIRRALTPIVETSSTEKDPPRPVISEAPADNPPQQSDGPAPRSVEVRTEYPFPTSTSPASVSTPSAYTPTVLTSTPISPKRGLSEESAPTPSVAKPNPQGPSSELPSNDDGQAHHDRAASITSLHSSAASPPPLSPADSSDPPASSSPALAPPRTPSPKLSVLTSPHSMSDSPTRGAGQSFGEFGSSTELLNRQSLTPPNALQAATVAPSKLGQEFIQGSTPPSREGTLDVYDEAGAMFYIHHLGQGSLEVDTRPLPDSNGRDVSSESEGMAYGQFPHHVQPTVAPLRTKSTSKATSPPPQQSAHSPTLSLDTSHRKPPHQQLPRTPTLDYGPDRRPFGARAAPASNRRDSVTSSPHPPLSPRMQSSIVDTNTQRGNATQFEDSNADALAALTFLEHHDDVPPVAPVPSAVATSPSQPHQKPPTIVEPERRSPSPKSDSASLYKSSFAPSKNAMDRKARSEAQQAAHEAATHRPGRGAGKTKSKAAGGWGGSSDEEEEEEDEDEDVDSDEQPVATRDDRSLSNYATSANNNRSQYSSPRGPSPLASGDASSYQGQPHARPARNLPPVPPPRMQGMSLPN